MSGFPLPLLLVHIVTRYFWGSINPGFFRQINVGEQESRSGILYVVLDAARR